MFPIKEHCARIGLAYEEIETTAVISPVGKFTSSEIPLNADFDFQRDVLPLLGDAAEFRIVPRESKGGRRPPLILAREELPTHFAKWRPTAFGTDEDLYLIPDRDRLMMYWSHHDGILLYTF
ncbi:hypothetical protein TSACC_2890 [Terrimicrobium sacchariphilum]|uniref:Uncharacterized protein n=1 Tax=Terrimicrobium sacchariphilum TaxID=690879 RepID=A0A146G4F4_TERSA|nr:hypothetical protein [Terrimicrobium sacchariphilum]GAT32491.1 hypothetical protein TSACC_2890 [Terrimicrobium sacchariphilum]